MKEKIWYIISALVIIAIIVSITIGLVKTDNNEINIMQNQLMEINAKIGENKKIYNSCKAQMEALHSANNDLRKQRSEIAGKVAKELWLEDEGFAEGLTGGLPQE